MRGTLPCSRFDATAGVAQCSCRNVRNLYATVPDTMHTASRVESVGPGS